uniref:Zgc:158343 n=1 Tax=Cyprinodon variegatus TaxID=28743 RepID=A0A3Q2DBJ6_CYPVA
MYSRSNSTTMTVQQERFAFSSGMSARSTQPEVFTFERIPPQATAVRSYVPVRPKKRCTRVMYPAKVRMHLPPPERSQAKRWLVILCLVVLWQIYTEEPCVEAPLSADCSIAEYRGFIGDPTTNPSVEDQESERWKNSFFSLLPDVFQHPAAMHVGIVSFTIALVNFNGEVLWKSSIIVVDCRCV